MLSPDEVLDVIDQGEGRSVEFKGSRVNNDSLSQEIVAFANSDGGVLLVGIGDDGGIIGADLNDDFEEIVCNLVRTNVIPALDIFYHELSIEGKKVAVIEIPKGKDKPYQTNTGRYYVRVGSTKRIATQAELLRLFQAAGVFHYDLTPVEGSSIGDLNFSKLDSYFGRYGFDIGRQTEEQRRTLLRNTNIITDEGALTVAGLLIFGLSPSRFLPQTGISFAVFRGRELGAELLDKQNLEGTLDYLVDTCAALLKSHVKMPSKIEGTKRICEVHTYSDRTIREVLTNALVHRNYSIYGSKIRVFLFSDRLEVISPGRLPNTVGVDSLRYGVSFAANPVIVKIMENLSYVDQLGRGLPMVYQEATSHSKRVEFKEVGEEFRVILGLQPI